MNEQLKNLAHQYLKAHGETVCDYDGLCGELANEMAKSIPGSRVVSVDGPGVVHTSPWTYHTVVMVNDMVHDAWQRTALPLHTWLLRFAGPWPIDLHIDGVRVFRGMATSYRRNLPQPGVIARVISVMAISEQLYLPFDVARASNVHTFARRKGLQVKTKTVIRGGERWLKIQRVA